MIDRYEGYLKPHIKLIASMHDAGASHMIIAERLYELGARAHSSNNRPLEDHRQIYNLAALVRHIRRKYCRWQRSPALDFWAEPMAQTQISRWKCPLV